MQRDLLYLWVEQWSTEHFLIIMNYAQNITFYQAKEKYRGVFEIQKSGDKTSSGEIGLDIRTHASPKVGQDQVSGGVSVPCRHATPVADALWKPIFGEMSDSVKMLSPVIKSQTGIGCRWSQQVEQMQVPEGTGPGVRRSKRPLLACQFSSYKSCRHPTKIVMFSDS